MAGRWGNLRDGGSQSPRSEQPNGDSSSGGLRRACVTDPEFSYCRPGARPMARSRSLRHPARPLSTDAEHMTPQTLLDALKAAAANGDAQALAFLPMFAAWQANRHDESLIGEPRSEPHTPRIAPLKGSNRR